MAKPLTLQLGIHLPWWWKIFLGGALLCHLCGMNIQPDRAAAILIRHTRFTATEEGVEFLD